MGFLDNLLNSIKSVFGSKPKDEQKKPSCACKPSSFKLDIFSPCDGEICDQKNIPDEGFSEGYMGQGIGIKPDNSSVDTFMKGKIVVLFKTKHAYIIQDEKSGVSVMLHLGINTVNIPEEKEAFTTEREVNEVIDAKVPLCSMKLDVIEKEATSTVSALLVQNDNMDGKKVVYHMKPGPVKKGDLVMSVVSA